MRFVSLPADPSCALSQCVHLTDNSTTTNPPFFTLHPTNLPPCHEGVDIKQKRNSTGSPPNQADRRSWSRQGAAKTAIQGNEMWEAAWEKNERDWLDENDGAARIAGEADPVHNGKIQVAEDQASIIYLHTWGRREQSKSSGQGQRDEAPDTSHAGARRPRQPQRPAAKKNSHGDGPQRQKEPSGGTLFTYVNFSISCSMAERKTQQGNSNRSLLGQGPHGVPPWSKHSLERGQDRTAAGKRRHTCTAQPSESQRGGHRVELDRCADS